MIEKAQSWLDPHRQKLILKGRILIATALARQILSASLITAGLFLFFGDWRA